MFGFGPWELVILLFIVPAYFMPSVIAYSRRHRKRRLILVLNALAGWTFFGWVGVLVWTFIDSPAPQEQEAPPMP